MKDYYLWNVFFIIVLFFYFFFVIRVIIIFALWFSRIISVVSVDATVCVRARARLRLHVRVGLMYQTVAFDDKSLSPSFLIFSCATHFCVRLGRSAIPSAVHRNSFFICDTNASLSAIKDVPPVCVFYSGFLAICSAVHFSPRTLNNVIKTKANATDNRLASSIAVYVKYTFIKLSPTHTKPGCIGIRAATGMHGLLTAVDMRLCVCVFVCWCEWPTFTWHPLICAEYMGYALHKVHSLFLASVWTRARVCEFVLFILSLVFY